MAAKITYLHNALGQSYVCDDGQLGNTPMLLGEYGNGGSQRIGLFTNNRLYAIHADHLNTPRQISASMYLTIINIANY